jgi:hypothetical protein
MNQELVEKYPKLQGMTNENLNKSIEYQETLIQEMIKLYSDDFEKRYIKRILGKNWKIESFIDGEFVIKDDKNTELKVEYDNDGNLSIDTLNLFMFSPIFFSDGVYIEELKTIIKLYENRFDIQEFICKFIETIEPMYESVRILKTALQ